jgi:hypothetical protein
MEPSRCLLILLGLITSIFSLIGASIVLASNDNISALHYIQSYCIIISLIFLFIGAFCAGILQQEEDMDAERNIEYINKQKKYVIILYLISLLIPLSWGSFYCVKYNCLIDHIDKNIIKYFMAVSILTIISYGCVLIMCCYNKRLIIKNIICCNKINKQHIMMLSSIENNIYDPSCHENNSIQATI